MSRTQIVLLVVLLLAAALLLVLVFRNPPIPFLPDDADHRGGAGAPGCTECHDPEGVYPRGQNHPVGQDCFRCHAHE